MELSSALEKVRKLLERAEHEATPVAEAQSCRELADQIMEKYAFDQAMARATKPVSERDKPDTLLLDKTPGVTYSWWLAEKLVRYCRCMMREIYDRETHRYRYKVYGFKSDLAYLEVLYTEVMLHMSAVLVPHWDKAKSLDENAYALHQMGLNWLQIGELLGWRKDGILERDGKFQERWVLKRDDAPYQITNGAEIMREMSNWQLGSYFKRACQRATKARGEDQHMRIAANGTENYRRSAAEGYVIEYNQRLLETERKRQSGAEIVLRGAADDLAAFFKAENPDLYEEVEVKECEACKRAKSQHCRKHPPASAYKLKPRDEQAYRVGVAHAKTAPLGGSRGMGNTVKAVDA